MQVGPYETSQELARGGQGVVYRARDPRTGGELALKLLLRGAAQGHTARRFAREVRTLERLDHPGIVRLLGAGEHEGLPYLAMELIQGEELARRLQQQGPLPIGEAVELALQLADALEHAHGQGVIHRDVKPSNVLLTADGPKLTDFGLVRDLDGSLDASRLSKTGVFLGTPGYWSPEQAQGKVGEIGPPADVYGLGATLYAMLTGEPPSAPQSLQEAIAATMREPPRPSSLRREVPPALDAVVVRSLAPALADRYASAAELAAALEGALTPPPSRSGPALAAGLVVLGGLLAAGVVWSRGRPAPAPTPSPSPSAPAPPSQALLPLPGPPLPDDRAALFEAAWTRALLRTRYAALEQRLRAAQPGGDDPALLALEGVCRIARSETGGLALLDRARALAPWDSRVLRAHALAWYLLGGTGRALTVTRTAIAWAPDDVEARVLQAILNPGAEATRADLDAAAAVGDSLSLRYYRGIMADAGRRASLLTVTEAAPHLAMPWFTLASGIRDEASERSRALLERVRELTDDSQILYQTLRLLAERFGDTQAGDAAADLQRELLPARLAYAVALGERGESQLAHSYLSGLSDPEDPHVEAVKAALELSGGSWLNSIWLATRAQERAPDLALARWVRARARLELGDVPGARADLQALTASSFADEAGALLAAIADLALPPLSPPALADLRARCEAAEAQLLGAGDHGWALRAFESVLAVAPDLARARAGRACVRVRLGYEGAPRELGEAIRQAPDDPDALALGLWATPDGELADGLRRLDELIARFPDAAALRTVSGYLRLYADPRRAARDLQTGVELGSATALLCRGAFLSYLQRGALDGEDLRQATALAPASAAAWTSYGEWLLGQERTGDAEAALVRAAELEPTLPEPHRHLATLYLAAGEVERGLTTLAKARALGRASSEWCRQQAGAVGQSGDLAGAVRLAEQAVLQAPTCDNRSLLGTALMASGRRREAAALIHDLLECRDLPAHIRPRVMAVAQDLAREDPHRQRR